MNARAFALTQSTKIPDGWKGTPVETGENSEYVRAFHSVQRVPARRFYSASGAVESLKPIEISFSETEDGVVAEISSLQLASAGGDVSEAMSELSDQLVHFFDTYSALREDQVVGLAARLRQAYLDNFQRLMPRA